MAQDGDTITYSFSDGTSVSEDVSGVNAATVNYCDGAGGGENGGSGGRVENAEIDVGGVDTLYIWVAEAGNNSEGGSGRYDGSGGGLQGSKGGGSTEISFSNTEAADSADEPFLVGSGGGGGSGSAGARGDSSGAEGTPPPLGGGIDDDGGGAIDDQNRGVVSGGTTITGGGSGAETNGEIQISYKQSLSPPDPPSNLSASVQ